MESGDTNRPRPLQDAHADTDWDLIRRVGGGDRRAFEMLYTRYYRYLFRFVYRITRRRDLVEEIINDVMFVVWQKAGTVEARSAASTWILGIAYHKSLKALHDSHSMASDVPWDESEHGLPEDDAATMSQVDVENVAGVALDALSPDQRAVMELAYYQEMHYGEIAEALGCPENTVKTRMFHARKKLRSLLPALLGGAAPSQGRSTCHETFPLITP